jgi:hypothetical protein
MLRGGDGGEVCLSVCLSLYLSVSPLIYISSHLKLICRVDSLLYRTVKCDNNLNHSGRRLREEKLGGKEVGNYERGREEKLRGKEVGNYERGKEGGNRMIQ